MRHSEEMINSIRIGSVGSLVMLACVLNTVWAPGIGAQRWQAQEVWRVGEETDDVVFSRITSLAVGPDGTVGVVDFAAQHVVVVSSSGSLIAIVGRPGKGPGEFDGPLGLAWERKGRMWIPDGWNQRYSVFDSVGNFVKAVPRVFRTTTGWRPLFSADTDSTFVEEISIHRSGSVAPGMVRIDTFGVVLDTLLTFDIDLPELSSEQQSALMRSLAGPSELRPLAPRAIYSMSFDGRVMLMRSDQPVIREFDLRGGGLRSIEISQWDPIDSNSVDDALRVLERKSGLDLNALGYGRQLVQAVHKMESGVILVQIETNPGEPSNRFIVLDPRGRYAGELVLPMRVSPQVRIVSEADMITLVGFGAYDEQYVVRFRVTRVE